MLKTKRQLFGIMLILILAGIIGGFYYSQIAHADNRINIFPASFGGDWQNAVSVLSQDLEPDAALSEFDTNNSAYPISGAIKALGQKNDFFIATTADENSTSTDSILLPPVSEENISSENNKDPGPSNIILSPTETEKIETEKNDILPKIRPGELSLDLSGFTVPETFIDQQITNVQLRLSMAGHGIKGDNLMIDYFYDGIWQNLAKINLEKEVSNYLNGGYFLYAMPLYNGWSDINNLKIRFIYESDNLNRESTIFLDSLWLEIELAERSEIIDAEPTDGDGPTSSPEEGSDFDLIDQTIPSPSSQEVNNSTKNLIFINPKISYHWDEEPEFSFDKESSVGLFEKIKLFFQSSAEIRSATLTGPSEELIQTDIILLEGENYRLKIKKPINWQPGNYHLSIALKRGKDVYVGQVDFIWEDQPLTKIKMALSLGETAMQSESDLDWYPENYQEKYNNKHQQINIDIIDDKKIGSRIILEGACQKEYYVILLYPQADDYNLRPSSFVYNKAFPCLNNKYKHELNDLPANLLNQTYYLLVAEQGLVGPWQPITAIQPINIALSNNE